MNFATKGCWTKKSFIDATFAMAKGGGAEIGPTKRGKGMKIMAIVDRHGLPLSVSTHAANHHEVRLVQLCFDFYMIEAKPGTLIGDRAYDSDPLDDELRKDGIEMVAPHRSNRRKRATQDGRRIRRYARRWLVERFFAWIQWQRRILVRWEFYPKNSLASCSSPASSSSSDDFEIGSSHFYSLLTICLSSTGRSVQQAQNCLACSVKRITSFGPTIQFRRKGNDCISYGCIMIAHGTPTPGRPRRL